MSPPEKKAKTGGYKLYYWGGIPGRGEYIRLAFEYAGESYSEMNTASKLLPTITDPAKTPAILSYLAPKFKLAGEKGSRVVEAGLSEEEREEAEEERATVSQLTLTALDICNEAHDVHHPIASAQYYEDQKEAALARAEDFRKLRIPKFLKHLQSVLASNPATAAGAKTHLVGKQTTTADLVLFHVIDGLLFAFPRRMGAVKESGEYPDVFALYERVKGEKGIKEYIASGRRQKFSLGLFRHYEELDAEEQLCRSDGNCVSYMTQNTNGSSSHDIDSEGLFGEDASTIFSSLQLSCGRTIPNRLVKVCGDHLSLGRDMVVPTHLTPETVEPFARLARTIQYGSAEGEEIAGEKKTLAVMQLSHTGRQSTNVIGGRWPFVPPMAPSAVPVGRKPSEKEGAGSAGLSRLVHTVFFQTPRPMSLSDIEDVVANFVRGAELAAASGFDGVQLHAAHGYLIAQFMSSKTNKREDKYSVPENALRFLREIVFAIREHDKIPRDFILGIKLNAADYVDRQNAGHSTSQPNEALEHVREIAEWGLLDFIEVSGGDYEDPDFMMKTLSPRQAFFTTFAHEVKQMLAASPFSKPPLILLTGGLRTLPLMSSVLKHGHADLLGIGRLSVLCPDLPRTLEAAIAGTTEPGKFPLEPLPEPDLGSPVALPSHRSILHHALAALFNLLASVLTRCWALFPIQLPKLVGAGTIMAWYMVMMRRMAVRKEVDYSVGGIEAVLIAWPLGIWSVAVLYMSTTWSITKPSIMCSTAPTIPADLVYHILDHLWSDPWTLFNCALTCRTWRDASRRLLKRGHVLTINDFENLDRISRLLNNKKTRHFYRDLQQLYIADDKEKPFLHILPLRLPGSLLPNVRLLRLSNIDWTSRRPHSSTLAMTTAFAAVIDISIDGSRFGSSTDIRQFISAFRNLTALELDGVNILSPVAGPRYLDLSKAACSPVKWLRMENLHLYAIPRGGSTAIAYLVFLNPILDLCSSFTSLSMLHIRRCTFGSFDDLRRFVCCFPRLRQLKMMDVGWDTTFPRRFDSASS
ncbi:hypothetical protein EVJ58_g3530 [Rhodofomes roseus]|uniref:GST C-terminal domain-containing protein n=1 Tax=Rhodofomes roseus TaxID=34475 RepID=A0A4Y9YMW1_9APHY|nr:hypothetical protein EVJ58_g3530 [Rhodofomes roseus]